MRRFSRYVVAVVTIVSGSMVTGTRLLAQTSPDAKSVVVAVLDNYPAFSQNPAPSGRTKAEIRAIVFRQDPTDATRSLIVVNPGYLTPETIYTALRALNTLRANNGGPNLTVINRHGNGAPEAVTPAMASLRPIIMTLLSGERSHLNGHPGVGRFAMVSDSLSQYFGTPAQ